MDRDLEDMLKCLAACKLARYALEHLEDVAGIVEARRELRQVIAEVERRPVVGKDGPAVAKAMAGDVFAEAQTSEDMP